MRQIISISKINKLLLFIEIIHQKTEAGNYFKNKKILPKKGIKFYLSNNIKLAIKLNLDGAYIPSFNKDTKHLAYSLKKFNIVGSAHNLKEIRSKENQNVRKIFLSSLFKKNKNYLELTSLRPS